MRLRLRAAAAVMLAGLALVGCDQKDNEAKHIKVGVINGAEQDVAEVAKKVAKEKYVPFRRRSRRVQECRAG